MDLLENPVEFVALASVILLLLLNSHRALSLSMDVDNSDDQSCDVGRAQEFLHASVLDMDAISKAVLHHHQLCLTLAHVDEDLGFWVKPRSTTWFSRFLLQEYNDSRWVQMFRMTKRSVLSLSHLLSPTIQKKDTRYRLAIPVLVRVACTLFKLSHGASLLICSELFAVGRSTVSMLLREVVYALNEVMRAEISWPSGENLKTVEAGFKDVCGLPGVLGAIDGTHFAIGKPKFGSVDYYYFKSAGFTMNCQAVVDSSRHFLDLFVGMLGSTNDSRMLRRSTLFMKGQHKQLWDARQNFHDFAPFLLGDGGYPLLPWLMVPHRRQSQLSVADRLFNRKLSKGRAAVENSFALLKQTFKELQHKSDLHVSFLPDVVIACALLHNVLLKQSHEEVETLLEVLWVEGYSDNVLQRPCDDEDTSDPLPLEVGETEAQLKRRELGVFLSLQRLVPA